MTKKDNSTKDLPLVPESVLKRRHDLDDLRRKKQYSNDNNQKQKQRGGGKGRGKGVTKRTGTYVKSPHTFLAQAKTRLHHQQRYHRVKKKGMMKRASNKREYETKEIIVGTKKKTMMVKNDDNDYDDEIDEEEIEIEEDIIEKVKYQSNSIGSKMVFVIRIREETSAMPRNIYDMLLRLNLKIPYHGVFVKYTPKHRKWLQLIEPWVIYGIPSIGIIQDLMKRKSYGYINPNDISTRTPLSDNTIVENALGNKYNIICMEDLIQEIMNVNNDGFDYIVKHFLCPFPLTCHQSKFEKELLDVKEAGKGRNEYGDMGERIDDYIKLML